MSAYPIKSFGSKPKYNISSRPCSPRNISIHYTGGEGSAKDNVRYFRGGDRQASADFFIDSNSIWRYNPHVGKYYTWAIGDGHGAYGYWNYDTIHIEVVSNGGDFTRAEKRRLRYLVGVLMKRYNIPSSRVVRHYDCSRKLCPSPYIKTSKWRKLHRYITS